MSITTVIEWNESKKPPTFDGYFMVYSESLPTYIQIMHYDAFLARWTVMEDDSILNEKDFLWADIPKKSTFNK